MGLAWALLFLFWSLTNKDTRVMLHYMKISNGIFEQEIDEIFEVLNMLSVTLLLKKCLEWSRKI